jgi:hypothetical protein
LTVLAGDQKQDHDNDEHGDHQHDEAAAGSPDFGLAGHDSLDARESGAKA